MRDTAAHFLEMRAVMVALCDVRRPEDRKSADPADFARKHGLSVAEAKARLRVVDGHCQVLQKRPAIRRRYVERLDDYKRAFTQLFGRPKSQPPGAKKILGR